MNIRNKKYMLHKYKQELQEHRNKQEGFDNRFTVFDKKKTYDALQDPHASYYFVSKSVRNHLKHIKNATINNTTNSLERERLKKLLNEKIKPKHKNLLQNGQFLCKNLNELITSEAFRKTSIRTVHSERKKCPVLSKQKPQQQQRNTSNKSTELKKRKFGYLSQEFNKSLIQDIQNEQPQVLPINLNEEQKSAHPQNKRKFFREEESVSQNRRKLKNYDEIHQIHHKKFLDFIQEKRKLLLESQ